MFVSVMHTILVDVLRGMNIPSLFLLCYKAVGFLKEFYHNIKLFVFAVLVSYFLGHHICKKAKISSSIYNKKVKK